MADTDDGKSQCWTRNRNDGSRYVTCEDEQDKAWRDAQDRCPKSPPRGNPSWTPYVGASGVFHCGYEGYIENHYPTPDSPTAECFYDEQDKLVDDTHPYSGCRGTPNQYPANDYRHTTIDRGGIREKGWDALKETSRHAVDTMKNRW